MASKRNHYRYELNQSRKVVYIGITNNPNRRETEHATNGKRFNKMNIVGPAVTKETAEKWEENRLESYQKNHGGKTPKYNRTSR